MRAYRRAKYREFKADLLLMERRFKMVKQIAKVRVTRKRIYGEIRKNSRIRF